MSHFDEACAAVQAALDAGARYADARVMVRRTESMSARDGAVEDLSSLTRAPASASAPWSARAGVSTRCPICPSRRPCGRPARRADRRGQRDGARPARSTCADRRRRGELGQPVRDRSAVRAAVRQGRPAGPGHRGRPGRRRRPGRGHLPGVGHRRSGSPPATATGSTSTSASAARASRRACIGDGEIQRRSWPSHRGQYGTRGWELVDELAWPSTPRGWPRRPGRC